MNETNPQKFANKLKMMLRRRGMDPKDYVFVKETYGSLYVKNIHTGVVKIVNKMN